MFNIQNFRSEIDSAGVLRTNRFVVNFNAPNYLQNSRGANGSGRLVTGNKLSLRCESVQMPGLAVASIDGPPRLGYGPIEAIPFGVAFDDVTLTFIVDNKGEVHRFFYNWFNSIVNFNSQGQSKSTESLGPVRGMKTYEVGYRNDFSTTLEINVYDTKGSTESGLGRRVMKAKVFRAFPKLLPSFDLSWLSTDEVVKLTIPFTYTDFTVDYAAQ